MIDELDDRNCVTGMASDEDIPSISRPVSRCAKIAHEDNYYYLSENLRSLFEDCEYADGIWLKDLKQIYELKFGYPLSPKEYGFINVMDMVANFDGPIFHVKQYLKEGDYLLRDARKFSQSFREEDELEGKIPKALINELIKMLKHQEVYTDNLLYEYGKMYQNELRLEQFGFKNLDSFLLHLEVTCKDIVLRKIHDRTLMKLNYATTDLIDARQHSYEALPEGITYDPFPPDVCNRDFRLEIDPKLAESKEGQVFAINIGEVYTPSRFYVTDIEKVESLESMMSDLNDFYDTREQEYRILPGLVSHNLLCVSLYSENSKWHRVRVMSRGAKNVKLYLMDYGTVEKNVSIEKLRYLHKNFAKHPAFCMRARLSGVQPIDGEEYKDHVCHEFHRLIQNCDLDAEVVRCLDVNLHAQTDCESGRMTINEILISWSLVEPKDETPEIDEPSSDVSTTNLTSNSTTESTTTNVTRSTTTSAFPEKVKATNSKERPPEATEMSSYSSSQKKSDTNVVKNTNVTSHHKSRKKKEEKFSWLEIEKTNAATNVEKTRHQQSKIVPEHSSKINVPSQRLETPPSAYFYPDQRYQALPSFGHAYATKESPYCWPYLKRESVFPMSPQHFIETERPLTGLSSFRFPPGLNQIPTQPNLNITDDVSSTLSHIGSPPTTSVSHDLHHKTMETLDTLLAKKLELLYKGKAEENVCSEMDEDTKELMKKLDSILSKEVKSFRERKAEKDKCSKLLVNTELMNKLDILISERMKSFCEKETMENKCFKMSKDDEHKHDEDSVLLTKNVSSSLFSKIGVHARKCASSSSSEPTLNGRTDDEKITSLSSQPTSLTKNETWNSIRSFVTNASKSK